MENITHQQILEHADCLDYINENDTYNKAYYYFIQYFSECNEITEMNLIIGSNFAYGWMPTILKYKSDEFDTAVEILNRAKHDVRISTDDVMILKRLINNSLVGVSKLLHFVNPNIYAIWDSRVCNFLTGKSYKEKVENINNYWSYLDLCLRVMRAPQFTHLHNAHKDRLRYSITPMRTIEQIMFLSSNTPLQ